MWDRDSDEQIPIAPGESCFRAEEATVVEDEKRQQAELLATIAKAQNKLRELRTKEEEVDAKIKALKSEMHRTREKGSVDNEYIIDVGILIDSEDNQQWLKKRAPEIIESLNALKREKHTVRVGALFYNPQKAGAADCRLMQFTDDFNRLNHDFPPAPRDPSTLSQQRTGLRGAIGEAINLLQWQGTVRLLLHPSPSSTIRKGQDPPTTQQSHFFPRFGNTNDTNVELQRAVLALRALYIDYFIVKTSSKVELSPKQKKGDGKFSVAIAHHFDDPESYLECRFVKIEETHNIKKAIISCIGMAMRS